MTNQHPITPPPELWEQWYESADDASEDVIEAVATQAARWGADQELEACVKWIEDCGYHPSVPEDFRNARRPKPPSLKEQALKGLDDISQFALGQLEGTSDYEEYKKIADKIRRALEQLND
jgi:hypothetical protein